MQRGEQIAVCNAVITEAFFWWEVNVGRPLLESECEGGKFGQDFVFGLRSHGLKVRRFVRMDEGGNMTRGRQRRFLYDPTFTTTSRLGTIEERSENQHQISLF
jgi:hypothetical protein